MNKLQSSETDVVDGRIMSLEDGHAVLNWGTKLKILQGYAFMATIKIIRILFIF
jgi:hypothetical protein